VREVYYSTGMIKMAFLDAQGGVGDLKWFECEDGGL
tara:strand:+ start:307 stop:414 length:108 start_codon:yes stop_codon:yes gene_type:complete